MTKKGVFCFSKNQKQNIRLKDLLYSLKKETFAKRRLISSRTFMMCEESVSIGSDAMPVFLSPPPPAAEGNPAQVAAEESDLPAAGDKAEDEPILNEADAAKQPVGNVKGDAAPASQPKE